MDTAESLITTAETSVLDHIESYGNSLQLLSTTFSLHFNENYGREQAKTADGTERLRICFPKPKKGKFTPKPIPVPKTYSWLQLCY